MCKTRLSDVCRATVRRLAFLGVILAALPASGADVPVKLQISGLVGLVPNRVTYNVFFVNAAVPQELLVDSAVVAHETRLFFHADQGTATGLTPLSGGTPCHDPDQIPLNRRRYVVLTDDQKGEYFHDINVITGKPLTVPAATTNCKLALQVAPCLGAGCPACDIMKQKNDLGWVAKLGDALAPLGVVGDLTLNDELRDSDYGYLVPKYPLISARLSIAGGDWAPHGLWTYKGTEKYAVHPFMPGSWKQATAGVVVWKGYAVDSLLIQGTRFSKGKPPLPWSVTLKPDTAGTIVIMVENVPKAGCAGGREDFVALYNLLDNPAALLAQSPTLRSQGFPRPDPLEATNPDTTKPTVNRQCSPAQLLP